MFGMRQWPKVGGTVGARRFQVEAELGRGGQGRVYQVVDSALQVPRALKVLDPALGVSARDALLQEARRMAGVRHPHVLEVFDVVVEARLAFLVLELASGTLADVSDPDPVDVVRWGIDLLSGLSAVHTAGWVHRDVKPTNVFLVGGRAKVGDFGVAAQAGADAGVAGSFGFMSPEQSEAPAEVDARSDLYGAAATLAAVCTSFSPTTLVGQPIDHDAWQAVPAQLRPILHRGMALDPDDRFDCAEAFADALADAAGLTGPERSSRLATFVGANVVLAPLHLRPGFEARLRARLATLCRLDSDPDDLRRIGHQLSGSAASYGHPQLVGWARRLEGSDDAAVADAAAALARAIAPLVAESHAVDDDPRSSLRDAALIARLAGPVVVAVAPGSPPAAVPAGSTAVPWDATVTAVVMPGELEACVAALGTLFSGRAVGAVALGGGCVDDAVQAAAALARDAAPGGVATGVVLATRPVVALAEDDTSVAQLVCDDLQHRGLDVWVFGRGDLLRDHLDDVPADLFVLDVDLPGLDGLAVLSAIRQHPSHDAVPVIMLTSLGGDEHVMAAYDLGADDYVVKPYTPLQLAARVQRHLRRTGRTAPPRI